MAIPIIERPLYGRVKVETSPWASTFTWTDRTADLVEGFTYSQGGRVGPPGSSQVEVGTLNASFKNLSSVPAVGSLIRVYSDTSGFYVFTGYVQDVSQRIIFDNSVSYNTPLTITTLNCVDWVGYISQFQAIGVGGLSASFVKEDNYDFYSRVRALNNIVDPTNATGIIGATGTSPGFTLGDTDYIGTFSDHLDLAARSQNLYWHGTNFLPTNITTGRNTFAVLRTLASAPSSTKTFTDVVGSAGQLHYTEIDLESSSQNVANTIVLNNFSVITATNPTTPGYDKKLISQIGGGNKPNYSVVDNEEVVSVPFEASWSLSDASSITTYGNRATEIDTNLAGLVEAANLISNPSAEYSDTGYGGGANVIVRRRKPVDIDPTFNAWSGEWAIRQRQATASLTGTTQFQGAESDGTPIIVGQTYYAQVRAARGNPSANNSRARIIIRWLNDAEVEVSSTAGSYVNLSTIQTWYQLTASGVAPAGASRMRMNIEFSRVTTTNINVGDIYWTDALQFAAQNTTYFDGDTTSTTSAIHLWTGELGLSPSFRVTNNLDDTISTYLTRYSTTSNRVTRIRWNAQEDLAAVRYLRVGFTISVVYAGTTTTYRIVGIDATVDPSRYMIDYYLEKV
jgi:hypothetical protein